MTKYCIVYCAITILTTFCIQASDCNRVHSGEVIPLLTIQSVKDIAQKSVDSHEKPKVSIHHLPQTSAECMNARTMFWEGEKYYQTQRYEDSIPYFLNAEKFYVPDCLKYLYKFIENEHYFITQKKVSSNSIERIRSQLPENVELEKLEKMYQERFLKLSFFTGVSPFQIHQKNRSSATSSLNRQHQSSKTRPILSTFVARSNSLLNSIFFSQQSISKED